MNAKVAIHSRVSMSTLCVNISANEHPSNANANMTSLDSLASQPASLSLNELNQMMYRLSGKKGVDETYQTCP